MNREETVSHLIDLIYEAAADASLWPRFLEPFAQFFDSTGIAMFVQDLDASRGSVDGIGFGSTALIAPEYLQSFDQHYGAINVWGEKIKAMVPGSPVTDTMMFPKQQLKRTEWFDGWLRPQDFFASMGVMLAKQDGLSVNLTFLRSARRGDYSDHDLRAFRLFVPHIQRAVALHEKLSALGQWKTTACELFERLKLGVILIDGEAKAIFVNSAAQRTMDSHPSLRIDAAGKISAVGAKDSRLLKTAIAEVVGKPLHVGSAPFQLRIDAGPSVSPLTLTILPLARGAAGTGSLSGAYPVAALFITDPDQQLDVPTSALVAQYGFTAAEALLASALVSGSTLNEFAQSRGITRNTVMTQMKAVMVKTGQVRQVDVVRMILSGPIGVLLDPTR